MRNSFDILRYCKHFFFSWENWFWEFKKTYIHKSYTCCTKCHKKCNEFYYNKISFEKTNLKIMERRNEDCKVKQAILNIFFRLLLVHRGRGRVGR